MKRLVLISLVVLLVLFAAAPVIAQDRGVVVVQGQYLPTHWQGDPNVVWTLQNGGYYGGYYGGYGGGYGYGYGYGVGEITLGEIITSIIPLERCQWVKVNGQKQQVCSGSRIRIGH